MQSRYAKSLLVVDAAINVVLGAALLFMPRLTIAFFGLPAASSLFYATILGAVLLGIGLSLCLEVLDRASLRGLGLAGAIIINLLGAGVVLAWLVMDPFDIPPRGYIVLWTVVLLVFATALFEILALTRGQSG